ncbi:MAG: SNF2-related protein [Candidatus Margulisiibacteriota bacterium]
MHNLPKIIDNKRRSLFDVIKAVAPHHTSLSVATGYWDLKGMSLIFGLLDQYKEIRILIGREPLIPRHQQSEPEPDYPDKDLFYDLERMQPSPELKELVQKIKAYIKLGTLKVKVYRKNFLHAKCYIFGDYESQNAIGIIGSSNFTFNGLTHNTELNALESDHRIVSFQPKSEKQEVGHLFWFDQFWNDPDTEDWNGQFTQILEQSPVGDILFSPYEMYIKTLYELYGEELEELELKDSVGSAYELLTFQKQNAQHLLRKLRKYGVAMLADSVGLGKTITAIEVIQNYVDSNEGRKRVEIICPKSLKSQWEKEMAKCGITSIQPIVLQNEKHIQSRMNLDQLASVSLFVIDESHNLRKSSGSRYQMIVDWVRKNKKAHVLLLTATPINNELSDLVYQILLGTGGRSDILKVSSVDSHVSVDFVKAIFDLQKKIKRKATLEESIDYEEIKRVMAPIIRSLVVRRTRQGIKKEFGGLVINGEMKDFPNTIPDVIAYQFPTEKNDQLLKVSTSKLNLAKLYSYSPDDIVETCTDLKHPLDQLDKISPVIDIKEIKEESPIYYIYQLLLLVGLIPYRWRIYQTKYYGKTVEEIAEMKLGADESRALQQQRGIYGIFRTIFLKRMESSISSIQASLRSYKEKLVLFQEGVKQRKIIGLKDMDAIRELLKREDAEILEDDDDQEASDILDVLDDKKYNIPALELDIERDLDIIDVLLKQLNCFEGEDPKLLKLIEQIQILHKQGTNNRKVLVFSYYADTINYLAKNMSKLSNDLINEQNSAFLSTSNRADAENLACRFSPKSKNYTFDQGPEITYLFSTDILSEGQNLQDCGIIINYDLHWNPVRMIQRNGRINRLGSVFHDVYVYNMKPEMKLESYLLLVKRLENKINMIKFAIGTDQTVLGEAANPMEFIESIEDLYSSDEKKRMDAMTQLEVAGDFLLAEDDFILDLKKFNASSNDKYKQLIYNIPKGKWGCMPSLCQDNDHDVFVLSHLYKEKMTLSSQFISVNRRDLIVSVVSHLHALNCLKTNSDDNQRIQDKIMDKQLVITKAEAIDSYASGHYEEITLKGQQKQIMEILVEYHYPFETIRQVRDSFQTTNFLYKKDIDMLLRQIIKIRKENKNFQPYLAKLIQIAQSIAEDKADVILPTHVKPVLYYVRENK